jgi:DNA-directed RNA polymerase II subunit RPB1
MSSIYKELSFENDIDLITGVQFTVMSPDEIVKRSVAEIVSTDTFSGNEPVIGGLFDNRMGVIEHNKICKTCEQRHTFCPGHFGHIQLAKPVFYIQFFDIVRKILKCVCWRCSKLLVDGSSADIQAILNKKISRQKRFELIYKVCSKVKRCGQETVDGCGAKMPSKITKENIGRIYMEWKDGNQDSDDKDPFSGTNRGGAGGSGGGGGGAVAGSSNSKEHRLVFNAEDVLMILKGIIDEDADILGMGKDYNRPEWLICTVFPVPPPSVRPSVRNETGQRCEDDLTHKLCDIVKTNNMLKHKIDRNSTKEQIDYWAILLQYHISTFVDNQLPGLAPAKQRTGRPLRSLTERLKSKEGRIRGNLMGKRVDFSARSVITPDPGISIDELGVPLKIAMNLTFPEVVNQYNREDMLRYVKNGPDVYPGAKYIRKHKDKFRTIRLKNIDYSMVELLDGDIVDRHLMNGDYVLFNRQPSLHKMSMMAHRVRVMPYDTFRLNVCVTPSYNADYDGDEMNMHVPQSLQTENELIQLAAVPTQIISPRDAKPIISIVQDIALGVYRLTKNQVYLTQKQYYNILSTNSKFSGMVDDPVRNKKRGGTFWSGKQVLSSIIPPNVNIVGGNKSYDPDKENGSKGPNFVRIENGQIKQGIIDKKIYQDMTNGIVHTVYNENGSKECTDIFDNTQKIICDWLVYSGFSVGISDLVIDERTQKRLHEISKGLKVDVYKEIRKIHLGTFENNSIKTNEDHFEDIVNNLLNDAQKEIGKVGMENIDDNNRMLNMIKSGSKGNTINLVQMVGCLGQQSVEGKRISYGFDNRTLPHFTKYDDGPESRGFVESSFVSGLTPQEFFFHAMGGREGLIDTAVKTSETGYIQRKLVKAMEDCKINFDMSVRNASGSIIQFLYGDDGMNAVKLENHKLPYIEYDLRRLQQEYLISPEDKLHNVVARSTIDEMRNTPNWERRLFDYYEAVRRDREFIIEHIFKNRLDNKIVYPISISRLIKNARSIYDLAQCTLSSDLNPLYVVDTIERLTKELVINKMDTGKKLFGILLRCYLNPKELILKHNFHKLAFDYIIQQIKFKFYDAIAPPSEMVGVVAAQSIGEPCTQLTLNTFHLSGVASASKAVRGVPRIKELLSVSKNMKAPSCMIYLRNGIKNDFAKVQQVLNALEMTYIKDVLKRSDIYYDPNGFTSDIEEDAEFMEMYRRFSELDENGNGEVDDGEQTKELPWVLRMEFDKMKMLNLDLQTADIHHSIYDFYGDTVKCVFSDDNADKIIFRIGLPDQHVEDGITELKALEHNIIETILIKGVSGIKKVSPRKDEYVQYDKVSGSFNSDKTVEWMLDTDGTNLIDVLCNPMVDATRTLSNDVNEIYQLLGIEAARECLLREINEVLNDSTSVNYRHIALLVDTMTSKGYMLSIDRHGINRSDIGPLAKCSFEETSDMLIKAGIFSEYDRVNGVSANIMLGQIPPCGTGDSEILIDDGRLDEYYGDQWDDEENDMDNMGDIDNMETIDTNDNYIDGDIELHCNLDKLEFEYNLNAIREEVDFMVDELGDDRDTKEVEKIVIV